MKDELLIDISSLRIFEPAKRKIILNSFDFTLKKGETHSIVGESGSGKTTFILSLFSLLQPNLEIQYKTFSLFGRNTATFTEKVWDEVRGKKIVLIPQNPSVAFHPYMKIGNQIEEFLNFQNSEKFEMREIIRSIEDVGIENVKEKLKKFPAQVSGGERQRILIASSLLANPEILVADEPTSSLDPINTKIILEIFKKATESKKIGLVLISHNVRLVQALSDKVTILKKGEVVEKTSFKNKFELKNNYSKALFSLDDFYKHS